MAAEEQRERNEADERETTDASRVEGDHQPEHADGKEQTAHRGFREPARDLLAPVQLGRRDLRAVEGERLHHGVEICCLRVRHTELDRLVGIEGQQLARCDDALDDDIGVDHGFGDVAASAIGFGGRAHLRAHVRHHFFADRFGFAARRCLDWGGCADRCTLRHDDVVTGEADQRAGADGARMDEGDGPWLGLEQGVANLDCRVDTAPECVDLDDDRDRVWVGLDGPPDERGEAELYGSIDRDDDDLAAGGRVDRKSLHVTLDVGARSGAVAVIALVALLAEPDLRGAKEHAGDHKAAEAQSRVFGPAHAVQPSSLGTLAQCRTS